MKRQNQRRQRNPNKKRRSRKAEEPPVLVIPTPKGLIEIAVRDSRQRSQLGKYWNAVQRYLATGDAAGLRQFRSMRIADTTGKRVPLVTDVDELDRLGSAGVLSFESLYAGVQ